MAYSEALAERVRDALKDVKDVGDRKMFGGICFTLRGNMLVGVIGDELMARVGQDAYEAALTRPEVRPMDFTGRPMKGYVFVGPAGMTREKELRAWIDAAMTFVETLPAKAQKDEEKLSAQKRPGQARAGKRSN